MTTLQAEPRSLYAISMELLEIEHALADMDSDPETVAAAVDAYLESTEELRTKVDRYCGLLREFEARAKARQEEAQRLSALAGADTRAAATLKARLHEFMKLHDIAKLETLRFKVGRQANGGVQALVMDIEPEQLPEEYRRTVTAIVADTDALRAAINDGKTIEGVRLADRGEHLRIR